MNLSVRVFARARDIVGADTISVELPDSSTVTDLKTALAQQHPGLEPLAANLHVAIGNDYATDDHTLTASDDIAVFPPVSGG
ncbi:MoaD/ThiS family protein [Thalassoroseus pseudoceratinae]|uniref:MoaD/ThiS family protein n=1 Tax=Thalassoroseus pseudoceratinae TaxID=2713176 RepID=UPI00142485F8|nr:MoaD/ThiS family protein [Thalassoroseus pseudoceratinae]